MQLSLGAQQAAVVPVPHTWAVVQQVPLMQLWPGAQQAAVVPVPQTWAMGQQVPLMQDSVGAQQAAVMPVPHTWALGQQIRFTQVSPVEQQTPLHEQVAVRGLPAGQAPTQSSQLGKPGGQPTVEIQGGCPFRQAHFPLGQKPVQHSLLWPMGTQGVPAP
jgi:hypothetical protein